MILHPVETVSAVHGPAVLSVRVVTLVPRPQSSESERGSLRGRLRRQLERIQALERASERAKDMLEHIFHSLTFGRDHKDMPDMLEYEQRRVAAAVNEVKVSVCSRHPAVTVYSGNLTALRYVLRLGKVWTSFTRL